MDKTKEMSFFRALGSLFARFVHSSEASFAFFICLLAITFVYRIQLAIRLVTSPVRPFDFPLPLRPAWFVLSHLSYDLALVFGGFLLSWLLSRIQLALKKNRIFPVLKISGLSLLHLILMALLIVHGAHLKLLFDAQTGLDYAMVTEAFTNVSLLQLAQFAEVKEYLLLLFPIGLFWLVLLSPRPLRLGLAGVSAFLIVLISMSFVVAANERTNPVPREIRLNPTLFLLSDVAERGSGLRPALHPDSHTLKGDESGLQPTGAAYVNPVKPVAIVPPKSPHPWNVVLFIMESVGTRYMFDTSEGNPTPMPFLQKLAGESWNLKRHYTSSNISTKAMFSILSGLYDFFSRETFGTRSDASVPSIYNFLAPTHESFLVTPSSITWYFPTAFLRNSGLPEIHSYENLRFQIKEAFHTLGHYIARDEIQTVDFFIRRLGRAKEPFLGIYISFTAHLPYFDYGPEYRIREEDGRSITRYYNNLNLLDHMVKRVYDHLKSTGQLERTIFAIVGDHGQAFGQHHPDNYMHYRYSYNENLETPVILYQPTLFQPRVFQSPTSHVDLLPTLLDAMRTPYAPLLFDGESLYHRRLSRKYIFFYGHEECISSLDTRQVKVHYSQRKNKCWAFDLKIDPDEKNPLDCSSYGPEIEALHGFVNHHDASLVQYNTSVMEKREFRGIQHPSLTAPRTSILSQK